MKTEKLGATDGFLKGFGAGVTMERLQRTWLTADPPRLPVLG